MFGEYSEYDTWVDIIMLYMVYFDVILGIDFVIPLPCVLEYFARTITLAIPVMSSIIW